MSWLFLLLFMMGAAESDYYVVETIPSPEGEVIEVGGLDVLPDGSLALSTRRGRVWIVENPDAEDPADAIWLGLCFCFLARRLPPLAAQARAQARAAY